MKNIKICSLLIISALTLSGCAEVLPEKVQVVVNEKKEEVKDKAMSELQKALADQIQDFIKSNDLKKTLGLDDNEESEISESFKKYLESYDSNPDEWKKAMDSFSEAIEKIKAEGEKNGLSKDEITKKIDEFLEKKE